MQKKGQVSIFVIIGLVLVILVALLWYLNDKGIVSLPGQGQSLSVKLDSIKNNVQDCANKGVYDGLNLFGKQGGLFNPLSYVRYKSYNVPYYCTSIHNSEKCLNIMPTLEQMRADFEKYMKGYMKNCVSADVIKSSSGIDVSAGDMNIGLEFGENVIVSINYNVIVSKEGSSMALDKIIVNVADTPVKEDYNVAHDIVEAKANGNGFDQNVYMVKNYGLHEINVDKPYPDIVYKVNKKDSKFEFWFAVQGEEEWIA